MESVNFQQRATFKFFMHQLNPEFLRKGFQPLVKNKDESNEHRYVLYYVKQYYDIRGQLSQDEVRFAAIPMSDRILVCHGKILGREPTFRVKMEQTDDPIKLEQARKQFVTKLVNRVNDMCGITLEDLPFELKAYIIMQLDMPSLINLAKSSHSWYSLIKDNNWLWKMMFRRDFGQMMVLAEQNKMPITNWKFAYESEARRRRFITNSHTRWIHNALPPMPYYPALPFYEPVRPDIRPNNFRRFPPYGPIELFWHDH